MTAKIHSTEYLRKARAEAEERDLIKEANEADAKERGLKAGSFNSAHTIESSKERARENPPEDSRASTHARCDLKPAPQNLNFASLGQFDSPTNNKFQVKTIKNKQGIDYSPWSKPPKGYRPDPKEPKELTARQKALLKRRKKS